MPSLTDFVRGLWGVLPQPKKVRLIAADIVGNVLLGGRSDQTISQAAKIDRDNGGIIGREICKALDQIDPGHCDRANSPSQEAIDLAAEWLRMGKG